MISNFHTHTHFCDGKNSPEEMVLAAIKAGCPAIGFSGHSNTPFDPGYCMDYQREADYRRDVLAMKEKYQDQIRVYLGLEQDYDSPAASGCYEYLIGSVHYVKKNGVYLSVDDTPEKLKEGVDQLYGGDFYSLCEDYYRRVADVISMTGCQIVGHFDLITKFNEKVPFFAEYHPRYRQAALEALRSLLQQDAVLEINTGAISRNWRREPYPDLFLLEEMGKWGARVILSSDAHRAEDLLFGLEAAKALAEDYHLQVLDLPPLRNQNAM